MRNDNTVILQGNSVEVENDKFERALRKFTRITQNSGVLKECKNRQHYIKASDKKKEAKKEARKKWLKKRRQMDPRSNHKK